MRSEKLFLVLLAAGAAWSVPRVAEGQDRQFGGYDCMDDCTGHAAGYRWAETRRVRSPGGCPVNAGTSFYEGCLSYTEDPLRGADEDDDGEPIDEN